MIDKIHAIEPKRNGILPYQPAMIDKIHAIEPKRNGILPYQPDVTAKGDCA
jgi:hypothetical protein